MTSSANLPDVRTGTTIVKILQKRKGPFAFVINGYNTETFF